MKKLNNKGWGFTEMFFFMGALIIFLGVAVFLIYKLYRNFEKEGIDITSQFENSNTIKTEDKKYIYSDLEYKMKSGTIRYINNTYNKEITEDIVITLKTLTESDTITPIKDLKDNSLCSGYVKVNYESSDYVSYTPYLKCSNYKTTGYSESLDER